MDKNTLAASFFKNGKSGQWLSVKQTQYILDLANGKYGDRKRAYGHLAERDLAWTVEVSPINGCGFFIVRKNDASLEVVKA